MGASDDSAAKDGEDNDQDAIRPVELNRRAFIGVGATALTGVIGLPLYATMVEPHWLEIVRRDLAVANLPHELNGATLAQVSDLHTCTYVDEDYLCYSLDRLAAYSPDIVAITGDFVTWQEWRPEVERVAQLERVLTHLPKARIATIAILGNHDYGQTWHDRGVADRIVSIVSNRGIRILRNEVATVSGLDFIGIDDLWSGRADTRPAFAQRTSNAAIALCHNPDGLDELPWKGYSGWILSGHTHGGQCKPPFLPPPILPVKNRRYTAGEIAVDINRKVYISRGIGHLYKVRFNVRPELTIFRLVRDSSTS